MTNVAIKLKDISFFTDRGDETAGLSFELKMGDAALAVGENPRRLTFFMHTCATGIAPASGRLSWFDHYESPPKVSEILELRRSIGLVHRNSVLISNMSLLDNMTIGLIYHHNIKQEEAYNKIRDLMINFQLDDCKKLRPAEVTHEQRRAAVYIRELARDPKLFVFDKPGIDLGDNFPMILAEVKSRVDRHECALLMSESSGHDLHSWVDWIIHLDEGETHFMKSADFSPLRIQPHRLKSAPNDDEALG